MANENILRIVSKKASGDLSGYQYYAVYLSANETVAVCNGYTHRPTGVLYDKPAAAGRACAVVRSGECPVVLSGTVVAGTRIMPTTDGTWIEAPAGWPAYGEMQEGGSSGEIRKANIFCEGGGSYTLSP